MDDLSGQGALTSEDIKVLRTGFLQRLPRDQHGREVYLFDRSRIPPGEELNHRVGFFSLQSSIYNDKTQEEGYVCLADMSSPWAASINQSRFFI